MKTGDRVWVSRFQFQPSRTGKRIRGRLASPPRSVGNHRLIEDVGEWSLRAAVEPHLIMKVRPYGQAGLPDFRDWPAPAHELAHTHEGLGEVSVARHVAVAVIQLHQQAVLVALAHKGHAAPSGC